MQTLSNGPALGRRSGFLGEHSKKPLSVSDTVCAHVGLLLCRRGKAYL
jgi:hypothetical protein